MTNQLCDECSAKVEAGDFDHMCPTCDALVKKVMASLSPEEKAVLLAIGTLDVPSLPRPKKGILIGKNQVEIMDWPSRLHLAVCYNEKYGDIDLYEWRHYGRHGWNFVNVIFGLFDPEGSRLMNWYGRYPREWDDPRKLGEK